MSVLLIVGVVTALAYHLIMSHSLTLASSKQLFYGAQAREYALGGEVFARQLLYDDWEDEDTREMDTLMEPWSEPLEPFEIDDGVLMVQIVDLSGRFNLNSVVGEHGPDNMERFKRLLQSLGIDENYADKWLDWIDEDLEVSGFGAEDGDYLLLDEPYRTANQLAFDVSELMAIGVFRPEELALLAPFVAALPTDELRVNVNTAPQMVMEALSPNFGASQAQSLVESPRDYADVETVTASYASLGDSVAVMAVRSDYFLIQVRAEVLETRAELSTLIHRDATEGTVTVMSRDFGKKFPILNEMTDDYLDSLIEDRIESEDA